MEIENIFEGLADEELPLDCIESPFYKDMRSLFNMQLAELLSELNGGEFQEGDITLKLNMEMMNAIDEVVSEGVEAGSETKQSVGYKLPVPTWEVKVNLKRSFKAKGSGYGADKRAFKFRDGRFHRRAGPVGADEL